MGRGRARDQLQVSCGGGGGAGPAVWGGGLEISCGSQISLGPDQLQGESARLGLDELYRKGQDQLYGEAGS
jgi:hypothetical protein